MYQVYPRSFADGNGDGEGDLPGLRAKLPYLADLGVDGLWISPWFPSPMADGGYDVSDFRGIHPMFGTLEDADAVLREARALGLRVIIDLVPNHTSDQHPWFLAALASVPGSPERARYFFRDGQGESGEQPPNNWISAFGGPAWTRVTDADGSPGQWYLHLFAPEQPDLDWSNEAVLDDFDEVLRFWFDRGVDGLRIDAAPAMSKKAALPDADYGGVLQFRTVDWDDNPHWDVDTVHDIFRRWRAIAETYDGDRVFVAEAVVSSPERLAHYLRPDEMHTAFNFPYLKGPWEAGPLREVIDDTLSSFAPIGVPSTWVLTSHDEIRPVTRYGRTTTSSHFISDGAGEVSDLALGTRRARAAAMLMLALPGGAYVYQGEELGLPNVDDLPDEVLQDPMFLRSAGEMRGRDGCRVPLPWSGQAPPFGFSPDGVTPWLPQPASWRDLTVEAQEGDPSSMLALYREALRLRRATEGLYAAGLAWRDSPEGVLDFDRGEALRCVANLSGGPVPVPAYRVVLSSIPLEGGLLPPDATAWLRP
ncbi:glycoside hydrolase family 13 protein [Pedococcus bigeumensis]|uniref:Glycoside hydrolase family 13 protein n=1 Tax=Pedococcus bigeumensis TaxID=433644 RepID=A0A502CZ02_9MICO|nr:glycoside hydrolase family 13 protein [Pedococcus bigeumensis]TPG17389.1 glycoside hydrolase family 13 protein [Pedococcus bigeumensis]